MHTLVKACVAIAAVILLVSIAAIAAIAGSAGANACSTTATGPVGGVPNQLISVPDAPHGFGLVVNGIDLRPAVVGFLDQTIGGGAVE